MKILFLISILISSYSYAENPIDCKSKLNLTLENGSKEIFCLFDGKQVSIGCLREISQCKLISDLNVKKAKISEMEPLTKSTHQNPGSWVCKQLAWKVLMGKMYDSSHVCVCQHPSGNSIICTSLIE